MDHRPAAVPGRLFDTGQGWPAAAFGTAPCGRTVPGWAGLAPRRRRWPRLLPELDAMEGIGPVPDRGHRPLRADPRAASTA